MEKWHLERCEKILNLPVTLNFDLDGRTDGRTDGWTDTTKCIISPASRSIMNKLSPLDFIIIALLSDEGYLQNLWRWSGVLASLALSGNVCVKQRSYEPVWVLHLLPAYFSTPSQISVDLWICSFWEALMGCLRGVKTPRSVFRPLSTPHLLMYALFVSFALKHSLSC